MAGVDVSEYLKASEKAANQSADEKAVVARGADKCRLKNPDARISNPAIDFIAQ